MALTRGVAYTLRVPFTSGATVTATVSQDAGAFSPAENACAEIDATGVFSLSLTAEEMDADKVDVSLTPSSGSVIVATLISDGAPTVDAIDAELTANHGAGLWGSAADGDTLVSQATRIDVDGNIVAAPLGTALGVATAGSTITAYLAADTAFATPIRATRAAVDGSWALYLAAATYTLVVALDGHYDGTDGDSVITRTVVVT